MENRTIDKYATMQNIKDWLAKHPDHSIDIAKLNESIEKPFWQNLIKETADACGTEIIYL